MPSGSAPVQAMYLGYAGTTGVPSLDYIITDGAVVPPGAEAHFSEQIVRLPHCFWPADPVETVSALPPGRAAHGLPEAGFVFCAFNAHRKINAEMFSAWMRLLAAAPGSVLWLRKAPEITIRNLLREAAERGISGDRLVFAAHAETAAAHTARQAHADLFLDTFPYFAEPQTI